MCSTCYMAISSHLNYFVLDCPDCEELAAFYARLLGWSVSSFPDVPGWANVVPPGEYGENFRIGCQQIPDFRPPTWPGGPVPQEGHLDFYVEDLVEGEREAIAAGATKHEVQPSETGQFVVFLDPVGHPFCLCTD